MVHFYGSEPYFELHNIYYDDGVPTSYGEKAIDISGEAEDSIKWLLKKAKKALKEPFYYYGEEFPKIYKNG